MKPTAIREWARFMTCIMRLGRPVAAICSVILPRSPPGANGVVGEFWSITPSPKIRRRNSSRQCAGRGNGARRFARPERSVCNALSFWGIEHRTCSVPCVLANAYDLRQRHGGFRGERTMAAASPPLQQLLASDRSCRSVSSPLRRAAGSVPRT